MSTIPEQVVRSRAAAYDDIYAAWHVKRITTESFERWMRFFLDAPPGETGNLSGNEIQFALQRLGVEQLAGRRVLDLCCGAGRSAVYLALRGAQVSGVDASAKAIEIARETALASGVAEQADFHVMDAQRLEFGDREFDAIYCQSALHILLDYPGVSTELCRVLKPGGRAIFSDEPLGHNPLIEPIRWWRRRRYRNCGGRTIRYRDILAFGAPFASTTVHHFNLFSQVKTYVGSAAHTPFLRGPLRILNTFDEWLLESLPWLRPLAAKVVVEYQKGGEPA